MPIEERVTQESHPIADCLRSIYVYFYKGKWSESPMDMDKAGKTDRRPAQLGKRNGKADSGKAPWT